MYKSYLTISWRSLLKNKGYSIINIGGLGLGMAVTILIGLWVFDEVSFNRYHANYDRIAQIRMRSTDPNTGISRGTESMQFPLAAALRANYGQHFKHILLSFWSGEYTLSIGDQKLMKTGKWIEPGVIDMFSLKMIKGSVNSLKDPHSIILSQSTALALFGSQDPINKAMKIDNEVDAIVTGVFEDLPNNTQFGNLQFISPWALLLQLRPWIKACENNWGNNSFTVFVELEKSTSLEAAGAAIRDFWLTNTPTGFEADVKKYKPELLLYPMKQWHLYSEFKDGLPNSGRITYVWLFGVIGFFVLLLACINFMNLTTARSEKRAKEVGIRKAIGSRKKQLVDQFLTECFLMVSIALFFALAMVTWALPLFNELADKKMQSPFGNPYFWLACAMFALVTGLLAGSYPSFYLSSFQPAAVLKGTLHRSGAGSFSRKALVVVQFVVSVVLICGTIVVYQQIQHASNRPVGYDREGIITVPMNDPNYRKKEWVLKNELLATGVVTQVSFSSSPLTSVWNNWGGFTWTGKDPELASDFEITHISHDFGKVAQWALLDGRDYSEQLVSDSAAVIINEAAAKYMNLKHPVGEYVKNGNHRWLIIGVIKDMIMSSPYEPVKRGFFLLDFKGEQSAMCNLRITPTVSAHDALPKVAAAFRKVVPSAIFDYKFVDKQYENKFAAEVRIGKLASVFAALAIFISCLGLFGLASFVAEQRTVLISIVEAAF